MSVDKFTKGYTKNMLTPMQELELCKQVDAMVDEWIAQSVLLYAGCSNWTSPGRNHATHLADDETRKPVCGKTYKGGALDVWHGDILSVTCAKCRRIIAARNTELREGK